MIIIIKVSIEMNVTIMYHRPNKQIDIRNSRYIFKYHNISHSRLKFDVRNVIVPTVFRIVSAVIILKNISGVEWDILCYLKVQREFRMSLYLCGRWYMAIDASIDSRCPHYKQNDINAHPDGLRHELLILINMLWPKF